MELTQAEQEIALRSKLFHGVSPEQLAETLDCLCAQRKKYAAGELVLREGEQMEQVGLVLSGCARSLKAGRDGEPLIVSLLEPGSFLGILLAASRSHASPVSVQAQEPLCVLFFPAERLIFSDGCPSGRHTLLLRNFLDSVAEQSLALSDRIACLLRPSVREKIGAYLARAALERGRACPEGGTELDLPLDRNAMARYLNVERSALSRELSRMRADGLIEYRKNHFRLL